MQLCSPTAPRFRAAAAGDGAAPYLLCRAVGSSAAAQHHPCPSHHTHQHQQHLQQAQQQPLLARTATLVAASAGSSAPATATQQLDDAYNQQMAKQMGWSNPYEYHFDRGLYLHEVWPGLFCGTQPRSPAEVTELAQGHGVSVILNLQQDKDMEYWGVDFGANQRRAAELGMKLLRHPAQDFDPHSLRKMLPAAVKQIQQELAQGNRVYVHCTAGLGRAPAVCIAWLYWHGPFLSLDEAYNALTAIRPCGPNRDAIRGATYDLLDSRPFDEFAALPEATWSGMNDQDKARLQQRLAHW